MAPIRIFPAAKIAVGCCFLFLVVLISTGRNKIAEPLQSTRDVLVLDCRPNVAVPRRVLHILSDYSGILPKHLVNAGCPDVAVKDRTIDPHSIPTGLADIALDHPKNDPPTWFGRTEFQTPDILKIIEKLAVCSIAMPRVADLGHPLMETLEELA